MSPLLEGNRLVDLMLLYLFFALISVVLFHAL
jgi:hypothetical protein